MCGKVKVYTEPPIKDKNFKLSPYYKTENELPYKKLERDLFFQFLSPGDR